ncbi:RHS repeat-associated core domain-containing protein [Burkholderia stabilis]|nr:RHS repeat-associated core domain-containing protein [Burkholderia stabilis]
MLLIDKSGSVLGVYAASRVSLRNFTPYGHEHSQNRLLLLLGFNGEFLETDGFYLLGNGYRAYNPVLVRFHSPDRWSPFDRGGRNAYGYCKADPVNNMDPSGHSAISSLFRRLFGVSRWSRSATLRIMETDVLLGFHGTPNPGKLIGKGYFSSGKSAYFTDTFESASRYAGENGKVFAGYASHDSLNGLRTHHVKI